MNQRIPLLITADLKFSKPFAGLAELLCRLFPSLKYDVQKASLDIGERDYIALCVLNTLIYFTGFFILFFALLYYIRSMSAAVSSLRALLYAFAISLMIFLVLMRYPKIIVGKRAELIDRHLVFALKDMSLQMSSGISLYDSMANIAGSNYGEVSKEFNKAVKYVSSGMSLEKALQKLAVETGSDFLKRAVWQIVNTIKVGSSIRGSLRAIIEELTIAERDKIRGYSRELNMWVLVYMLFAVAVPTIGTTVMIILSAFSGYSMTQASFISFLLFNFAVQYVLIGFVKYRRPLVNL